MMYRSNEIITLSAADLAKAVMGLAEMKLPDGERPELVFYSVKEDVEGWVELSDGYGICHLELFDAGTFIAVNYYGGGSPYIFEADDVSEAESFIEEYLKWNDIEGSEVYMLKTKYEDAIGRCGS